MLFNSRYWLILGVTLLLLGGCKKSTKDTPYYTINDEILSFVKLTTGTYYIYKDSASGINDSVIVTESTFQQKKEYFMPSGDRYFADYFRLVIKKALPAGTLNDWMDAAIEKPGYEAFLNTNAGTGKTLFFYPYTTLSHRFEIKASALLNGTTYSNIHCFHLPNGETCWWVKNVGIVKITNQLPTGLQTFTLVKKG